MDERLFTLTIDDLHLLNNLDILKSLPLALRRLPRSFVVLLLSRNEPPEPLRVLFKNEKTAYIRLEDLAFSEKELKAYFNNLGRSLSQEEARFILMATGGLALGVNAYAKSGMGKAAYISGKTEYVFANYIREQLWESWDKSLRDFMLKTSVVDEMPAPLVAALTGRKDADTMLRELCASNIFVSQAGRDMFRYHHLFLDFLRNMAKESGMNMRPLFKAAAEYYLEAKQYVIARHYAIQSGYDKIILKVIYQFNQHTNPPIDEHAAYLKIFVRDVMPKGICEKHPYLYTTLMEGAWAAGDSKMVELAWDKLREYLPVIAIQYPQMLETVLVELGADYRRSFAQLIDDFPRLPSIFRPKKGFQVSTLSFQLPFFHRSFRDLSNLYEFIFQNDANVEKLNRSFGWLLKDLYSTALNCLESGFLLEKNSLEDALAAALKAKEASADIQSPEIVFCAYNQLTAVYLAMGNTTLLQEALLKTEWYIEQSSAHFLVRNFLAWKTKIRLYDADKKAAEEWVDNNFVSDETAGSDGLPATEQVPLYQIFQCFTTVRAYIALNQGSKALAQIEALMHFARDQRRPMDLAEALTLKACLEWASGQRAEAADSLEEALRLMQPHGYIRIIADEGAAIIPVLKRIATAISAEGYEGNLDRAYITEILLAAHRTSLQFRGIAANFKKSGKPVKLSRQQKKMLEFLAQGYTNQEIARICGIALPTVKGHLMLAYEKLEVHNAMDALLKARSLGLLSNR